MHGLTLFPTFSLGFYKLLDACRGDAHAFQPLFGGQITLSNVRIMDQNTYMDGTSQILVPCVWSCRHCQANGHWSRKAEDKETVCKAIVWK